MAGKFNFFSLIKIIIFKAAESAENHARLVDAMSELKAKENTIHELHKIVKAVKVAKCRKKKLNLLLFCF